MSDAFEESRRNIEALLEFYKGQKLIRNEATTRMQLIDRLFFECLGWARDDMYSEENQDGDYADYTFLAPRRILIVEAKKEGTTFEFPVATKPQLKRSLKTLLHLGDKLKDAIDQVTKYCQSRGVPFAAVCNGHQLIAFIAVRLDGIPPMDGQAVVFDSLESMAANFLYLWQSLSKPGIEQKHLELELTGKTLPPLPPKLSATTPSYPGVKGRNHFQTDLQILSDLIIEDITTSSVLEEYFYTDCYCESGALSQHALVSKAILEARYHALFEADVAAPLLLPAKTRQGINPELVAESFTKRPILLLGDVGVGKTAFLKNLIHKVAAPLFKKALTFHLDLGSQGTLSSSLNEFVLSEIIRQLDELYGVDVNSEAFVCGVYDMALQKFDKGIYASLKTTNPASYEEHRLKFLEDKLAEKDQHLRSSLEHISKARKKAIIIFLDNADQRSELTQEDAFLIAQELAEHWPATVFLSLRPETFHRSVKIGALSGYHPKAFTIQPPRVGQVIEKRLRFALKITGGEISLPSLTDQIRFGLPNLDALICVMLSSLSESHRLMEFVENITGGNVRLALDLVEEFFGSGHVDTRKIVELAPGYIIPLHEVLRAVIYGDLMHYDPQKSPIANIFDVPSFEAKEHFIMPLALSFLDSPSGANVDEGFVETTFLYQQLQGLGFIPDQIDAVIVRAHRAKLIETAARRVPLPGQEMPPAVRLTQPGVYHLRRLSGEFTYVDAVIIDTPIFDAEIRDLMKRDVNILDRLDRAELFCRYLDEQWRIFEGLKTVFKWPSTASELRRQIRNIRQGARA